MSKQFHEIMYTKIEENRDGEVQIISQDHPITYGKKLKLIIFVNFLLSIVTISGLIGVIIYLKCILMKENEHPNAPRTIKFDSAHKFSYLLPSSEYIFPEQIHVSLGDEFSKMYIHWITNKPAVNTLVEYGLHNLSYYKYGQISEFIDGGEQKRKLYVHLVLLENLLEDSVYFFHCGSFSGWSKTFHFKTLPSGNAWVSNLIVYGDMGIVDTYTLPSIRKDALSGDYHAILHIGDFAYNLADEEGRKADIFMNQIQDIATYIPYMASPGNHEYHYNFSNYKARFPMMGTDGMYYSYTLGYSRIISISTEVYFYTPEQRLSQKNWLIDILEHANIPENREKYPWIILLGHRPMYCTNDDEDDCASKDGKVRNDLEHILYDYGVDIALWAHEHTYERLWPLYNMSICKGAIEPYTNPDAPIHIITGSAGSQHGHDPFGKDHEWSAYRSQDWGYAHMKIFNSSHLYLEQISVDQGGQIEDFIWVIKENHKKHMYNCHLNPNAIWRK